MCNFASKGFSAALKSWKALLAGSIQLWCFLSFQRFGWNKSLSYWDGERQLPQSLTQILNHQRTLNSFTLVVLGANIFPQKFSVLGGGCRPYNTKWLPSNSDITYLFWKVTWYLFESLNSSLIESLKQHIVPNSFHVRFYANIKHFTLMGRISYAFQYNKAHTCYARWVACILCQTGHCCL